VRGEAEGAQESAAVTCASLCSFLSQDPIQLRYRLAFTQGVQPFREGGVVTGFPEAELWGRS